VFGRRRHVGVNGRRTARDCERGSAAIEFALVTPLLVMLLVGAYAVGYALHSMSSIRYALDAAGRSLRLDPSLTTAELQSIVDEKLGPLNSQSPTLSMMSTTRDDGANVVKLVATYGVPVKIPLITSFTVERSDDIYVYTGGAP
jgi:Flp pilus assembly protein TadG